MDPSRNCNKVIELPAFTPFRDDVALSLEFEVSFVASETVRGYAVFGAAGDHTAESGPVPPLNHMPPDAEP